MLQIGSHDIEYYFRRMISIQMSTQCFLHLFALDFHTKAYNYTCISYNIQKWDCAGSGSPCSLPAGRESHILHAQRRGCWCPLDAWSQSINSDDIELVLPKYSGFSTRRIKARTVFLIVWPLRLFYEKLNNKNKCSPIPIPPCTHMLHVFICMYMHVCEFM